MYEQVKEIFILRELFLKVCYDAYASYDYYINLYCLIITN